MSQPKITGAPDSIWLVYGELDHDDTHANCCRDGEVTWCEDGQFDSDVRYVRADRLAGVEAERDNYLQRLNNLHINAKADRDERDRLSAEVEALRADAERYRWLRDKADLLRLPEGSPQVCITDAWGLLVSTARDTYPTGQRLDAAIDAAMQAGQGKEASK